MTRSVSRIDQELTRKNMKEPPCTLKKLWKFKPCRCFQEEIPNIYEGFLTLAVAAWLGVPPSEASEDLSALER